MFIAEEQCIAPVSVRCRLSATLIQRHHPLHLAHLHGSMPLCASVQCHPSATPNRRYPCLLLPGPLLIAGLMSYQTPLPGLVCPAAPLVQSSPKHRHSPTQFFTYRHFDVRPSYAWSLVTAQSQTVDQTPLVGWGKSAPLQSRCELNVNLLGRPCGAGWSNKEYYAVDKFRVLAYNRDIPGIYQCCEMFQELMQVIPWIYQIHLPNV